MGFSLSDLDRPMLEAHGRGDWPALVSLYTQAADFCESAGNVDAACFYLTQAFIFALQTGATETNALQARLWRHGREASPDDL